jgi:acyl-CoA thioester hydrolase
MVSETKITVRYQETDKMGIVHHSVYPIWFECGRTDYIKKAGMTYSQMEKDGVKLPLLSLKCRFLYPSYYEDEITVKTGILDLSPTRITFCYDIYRKGHEKPIVQGQTEHVWANDHMKPVNMKKYKPDLYQFMNDLYLKEESNEREQE